MRQYGDQYFSTMVIGFLIYKIIIHQDLETVYMKNLECFSEKNSACWGQQHLQKRNCSFLTLNRHLHYRSAKLYLCTFIQQKEKQQHNSHVSSSHTRNLSSIQSLLYSFGKDATHDMKEKAMFPNIMNQSLKHMEQQMPIKESCIDL